MNLENDSMHEESPIVPRIATAGSEPASLGRDD